jgi:uncharacterized protein (DUF302 family)/uncharacterized membrane protein YidH (DUF202 family)
MDPRDAITTRADLRDYLAAERTLLAWIRTGLALMGFGFVVARFVLVLRELLPSDRSLPLTSSGMSLWFGVALISAGMWVNVSAAWHHVRLVRHLDGSGGSNRLHSYQAVALALFLAVVGLAMTLYLVSLRSAIPNSVADRRGFVPPNERGIVTIRSTRSVDQVVERLTGILEAKGVTLFALVDHSGEAHKVGMAMRPTKLLIFGNPRAGTPVMLAAPSIAIDLPLKILVSEDEHGTTSVSYNSPQYLMERHGVAPGLLRNIATIEAIATAAAE